MGRNWRRMFAMEGSGAAIGNGDWLLGLSCVCIWRGLSVEFRQGFAFWGYTLCFRKE
jgi:hypothetical protein